MAEIEVQGQPHILIREDDIIGVMPRSPATGAGAARVRATLSKRRGSLLREGLLRDSRQHAGLLPALPRLSPGARDRSPGVLRLICFNCAVLHLRRLCCASPPADIPELKPLGDRILVKVQEAADITMGAPLAACCL